MYDNQRIILPSRTISFRAVCEACQAEQLPSRGYLGATVDGTLRLDEDHGTGATTRVLIDASDGRDIWGSIGVNENIIAASWEALVDSLAYAEQPGRSGGRRAEATPTDAA